ncbi:MAG: cytochrome o ubiquinol oxidase subunit IV [Patescibacteria group bacterium]
MSKTNSEHGTMLSYVIGYILSLVFTFIPYYMVVNKTASGTALLATILGFAVFQMIIQILFFLHLGREPKPRYNLTFFIATVTIILVVVGGSLFIMSHLYDNMTPTEVTKKLAQNEGIDQVGDEKTGACQQLYINHKVIIANGKVSPINTEAGLCDTLTFLNQDDKVRVITFGTHPDHKNYAGQTDQSVRKGRGKSITLNQEGTYQFHDHLDPGVTGYFTVKSR